MTLITLAFAAALGVQPPPQLPAPATPAAERLVEIRVHGNYRATDAEILQIADVAVGAPVTSELIGLVQSRLEASGRFEHVEVRKRWRSLESMEDVVLVLLVREPPVGGGGIGGRLARAVKRPMLLPILSHEDGYGVTYGVRIRTFNLLDRETSISFPLTWGGTREAAVNVSRRFAAGPVSSISSTASIRRQENPHFDLGDRRASVALRADRRIGKWLRAGASGSWSSVSFGSVRDQLGTWGADLQVDTRSDPELPRSAVYLRTAWDRVRAGGRSLNRYETDARGFIGLPRGTVLALRVLRMDASAALPPYEQNLLGGAASLRGFRAGYEVGDRLLAGSAELRIPLNSPVSFGRTGAIVFVDSGAAYANGSRLAKTPVRTGVGAGVFLHAAVFKLNAAVARGFGPGGWRLHLSTGFQF